MGAKISSGEFFRDRLEHRLLGNGQRYSHNMAAVCKFDQKALAQAVVRRGQKMDFHESSPLL